MASTAPGLAELAGRHREWKPWLAVLGVVAQASRDAAWLAAVPTPGATDQRAPLLTGVEVTLPAGLLRAWLTRLAKTAAAGAGAAATLTRVAHADTTQLATLFEAALEQDASRLTALAQRLGAEPGALHAVASVAPVPLLRACAGRWASHVSPAWSEGYCPVCGAWPLLAEARGLERARRLRCSRCAADWATSWLRCAYCGTSDHARLGALVAEGAPDTRRIETCGVCGGYLKTITTLAATAPDDLGLLDLTTVELDVAATTAGYGRPGQPACELGVRLVVHEPRGWGLLAQRAGRRP
jgi:FdhE protein